MGSLTISSREERLAKNETVLRDINEHIREGTSDEERAIFLCECGRDDCEETVSLSTVEYGDIRAHARRFFVVAGHELDEIERVVDERDQYRVTEKSGRAGDIAEEDQATD